MSTVNMETRNGGSPVAQLAQPQEGSADAPSGFILKLYQMVNGAPDEVISVSLLNRPWFSNLFCAPQKTRSLSLPAHLFPLYLRELVTRSDMLYVECRGNYLMSQSSLGLFFGRF